MKVQRRVVSAILGACAVLVAGVFVALQTGTGSASAARYSGYAMVYFTESPDTKGNNYGLHLAVSSDGLTWKPLNQNEPVAMPTLGSKGLRDPFVLRKQDGKFVVMATDLTDTKSSYKTQSIHVWDSTNLIKFTNYRRLKLRSKSSHAWAPEAFWDAKRKKYGIIYSGTVGKHNAILVNYTADFRKATGPHTFFDPGVDTIHGNLVSSGGINYLYYKNNKNGTLNVAKSTTLKPGSFKTLKTDIHPGRVVEAPEVIKSNTGKRWFMYGDSYAPNGRLFAWQSTKLASGKWKRLNDRAYTQPLNAKHPGITRITKTEMTNLTKAWGAPKWKRIKSYNFPGRYWRHSNFAGRIDAYPFAQYQDQQWKIVRGLAGTKGISFLSLNNPDMFLRQSNFSLVLSKNDGTTGFAEDATFIPTPGLADSSWTSYQSYSHKDRFIRHYDFQLRLDVVSRSSSTTEKQDATFRVGY